jgi:hypothetical protein
MENQTVSTNKTTNLAQWPGLLFYNIGIENPLLNGDDL